MEFDAIGTRWSIETDEPLSARVKQEITSRIETFDVTYSRFRDDSLVSKLTQRAGEYQFPNDAEPLIEWYRKLYDATSSAFTPLVGDTLNALGYDSRYSFQQSEVVKPKKWDAVMTWSDATVTTRQPVTLDFGAAGKGYLVDIIGALLEQSGYTSYVIDASGDVRHRGTKEQVIGLENPNDPTRVIGAVPLKNASICASATNRRQWGNGLHHVIDGKSGKPTNEVVASWVIAETTMIADGIATALFFSNVNELQSLGDFQFVRLYSDGKVEYSKEFVGELFV